jgi:hypothetical protein
MTVFVILRRNWNLGVDVVTINLCAGNTRIVFYYQAEISYKHVTTGIRFVIEIWRTQGLQLIVGDVKWTTN